MARGAAGARVLTPPAFHAYGLAAFTRVLGMDHKEADRLCTDGVNAVKNKNNRLYNHL